MFEERFAKRYIQQYQSKIDLVSNAPSDTEIQTSTHSLASATFQNTSGKSAITQLTTTTTTITTAVQSSVRQTGGPENEAVQNGAEFQKAVGGGKFVLVLSASNYAD
ncbi:unnamed protein product [Gongylonema pulchrum]|uniref:Uncharacterized protein n=1 Tax=Gongylonema pulchrum TaxID=637853 RepID=A0A183EY57_9BILA|nr:unnamed protein product [Gongylonema pulchrum]